MFAILTSILLVSMLLLALTSQLSFLNKYQQSLSSCWRCSSPLWAKLACLLGVSLINFLHVLRCSYQRQKSHYWINPLDLFTTEQLCQIHMFSVQTPKCWTGRFLMNLWAIFCLLVLSSYTANLAAVMVGEKTFEQVSGIHDEKVGPHEVTNIPHTTTG